jgi:tetratricopeptide (TPR) repeat protein
MGAKLRDAALVKEGMAGVELVLNSVSEQFKPRFLYNLANGHLALHDLAKSVPGFRYDPVDTPLTSAKAAFRTAISGERHIDRALRAKLRVNYANCLSHLGRPLEALAQYDRALSYDPEHAMAWGNLAVEMKRLARIARDSTLYHDAVSAVNEALQGDRLERIGEAHARQPFLKLFETLEGVARQAVPEEQGGKKPHGKGARLKRYEEFCVTNQLFLNLDALHRRHRSPRVDYLYFPLITGLEDDTTFPRLARVFSEAKECYAGARLLLFEAVDHPYATRGYDELTYIPYNLDYSVHGIRPGKLKAAFTTAYNVLDKLAVFIGRYVGIVGADRTDFEHLWVENDETRKLRCDICRKGNNLLFGLYDMSRDLDPQQGHHGRLRRLRNRLTHRYLVLHTESRGLWRTEIDGDEYHIGYREFSEATIELLALVRAAIANSMLYVAIDQAQRNRGSAKRTGVVHVPRCEHFGPGPLD